MAEDITIQSNLKAVLGPGLNQTPAKAGDGGGLSFEETLRRSITEVNSLQEEAGEAVRGLVSGEQTGLHETLLAMEQASLSFRLMMQVRGKIVEAYREVMRTQV